MATKKKKKKHPVNWRRSEGKKLLLQDVRYGRIPDNMDWQDAFKQRPEFDVGISYEEALRLFQGCLRSARKQTKNNNDRASRELALLQQDRAANPPPATNHRGEPRWQDSIAQSLLKQDVANNVHLQLSRTQFYLSRPEYQVYPKRIISGHVEQEVRLIKFLKQYMERRRGF